MAENSEVQRFLATLEREHATTARVLRAFPADQMSFQPHERSNSAARLAWLFVGEERLMLNAAKGVDLFGSGFGTPPETWDEIVAEFESVHQQLLDALRQRTEFDGTVKFFVAPKQMGDIPLGEFLWFLLLDQIHHRGQMSVYLRMVGAKVPSIYGPTADEPWT